MYLPRQFEETRIDILHGLMQAHPLATLITLSSNGLEANHIPLHLGEGASSCGVLRGHVARANPIWRDCPAEADVLAIFHGPQAYISPSLYATKADTGEVVPTWNYAVVHAYGRLTVRDDPAWIRAQMDALTGEQEAPRLHPWAVADAPEAFTDKLIGAVVGIEIVLTRLTGKWKVSQNQPLKNRHSVAEGLQQDGTENARSMEQLVRSRMD